MPNSLPRAVVVAWMLAGCGPHDPAQATEVQVGGADLNTTPGVGSVRTPEGLRLPESLEGEGGMRTFLLCRIESAADRQGNVGEADEESFIVQCRIDAEESPRSEFTCSGSGGRRSLCAADSPLVEWLAPRDRGVLAVVTGPPDSSSCDPRDVLTDCLVNDLSFEALLRPGHVGRTVTHSRLNRTGTGDSFP